MRNINYVRQICIYCLAILSACGGGGTVGTGVVGNGKIKIEGVIVDPSKNPVPDVKVNVVGETPVYTSDNTGKYSLETNKRNEAILLNFAKNLVSSEIAVDANEGENDNVTLDVVFDEDNGTALPNQSQDSEPDPNEIDSNDIADKECALLSPPELLCGENGKTYPNACEPRIHAMPIAYPGACSIEKDCTTDYVCLYSDFCEGSSKVCGKDNKTYSSAEEAHLKGVGVVYHQACIKHSKKNDKESCYLACAKQTRNSEKVCAEGKTFDSECEAIYNRYFKFTKGPCPPKLPPTSCPADLVCGIIMSCPVDGPVCGRDGITYPSVAAATTLTGPGLAYHTACIDNSTNINCGFACVAGDGSKVCGVDGVTYDSSCFALVAHVEVAYDGYCKGSNGCGDPFCEQYPCRTSEVCGYDGKTYGTKDQATAAGVEVAYHRSCIEYLKINPPDDVITRCYKSCETPPPGIDARFCGDDGVTYESECDVYQRIGNHVAHRGAC